MKLLKKIDREFLYLLSGRLLQALLAIGSLRLMTELLPKHEVGQQYLINSVILWFSLVLINPVGMFINRHLHEWQSEKALYSQIKKINLYFLSVAFFATCVVFFFGSSLLLNSGMTHGFLFYVLAYVFLSTWFQTLVSFFNLLNWQKYFTLFHIAAQGLGLLAAVTFIQIFGAVAEAWLWGLLTGQVISLMAAMIIFNKKVPRYSQNSEKTQFGLFSRQTLSFCIPVALATLFMWFNTQGYRLLVEKFAGLEFLAALGVGLGVAASVAAVVESVTTQYLQPKYYASLAGASEERRSQAWSALWKKSSKVYLVFCLLVAVNSGFILQVLTAEAFHHLREFVLFGALLELMRQCSNITYLAAHSERQTERNIKPYLLGGVVLLSGLLGLKYFDVFISQYFLGLLLLSALVVLLYNIRAVRNLMSSADFNIKGLGRFFISCLPILLIFPFTGSDRHIYVLLGCAVVSGLWALFLLIRELRFDN